MHLQAGHQQVLEEGLIRPVRQSAGGVDRLQGPFLLGEVGLDLFEAPFAAPDRFQLLAIALQPASLTRVRCIGALIERKFFCDEALSRSRGSPRCRHSVIRTCLRLHLLKVARLLPPLMAGPSPAMLVRCYWGRRTGCSG